MKFLNLNLERVTKPQLCAILGKNDKCLVKALLISVNHYLNCIYPMFIYLMLRSHRLLLLKFRNALCKFFKQKSHFSFNMFYDFFKFFLSSGLNMTQIRRLS